ncbi:hypothetical protein AAG570_005381 [Ranatra chinensis]|uniref:Uncharacterized protein n=1 Tax=Ranatra chinensis TaxID=642074 RepID=A0ABD0Y0A4_9HEMI
MASKLRNMFYENEGNWIQLGLTRFCWNTLNLDEFCEAICFKLKNVYALYEQIKDMESCIDFELGTMVGYKLFPVGRPLEKGAKPPPCSKFFQKMIEVRKKNFSKVLKLLSRMTPMINKLEAIVLHTSGGYSPYMALFYKECEEKIFDVFVK